MAKPTFSERFCFPVSEGEPSLMTFSASNHRLMGHKLNISRPSSETIGRLLESFFFRTPVPPANTLEYRPRRVIQQERVEEFAKCYWPQIQLNVNKLNTRMLLVNVLQAVLIFSLRGSPSRPQRSRQGTRPPFIIPLKSTTNDLHILILKVTLSIIKKMIGNNWTPRPMPTPRSSPGYRGRV
jgi:hypothetical protein